MLRLNLLHMFNFPFFNSPKRNFNLQRIRWSGTVTDPGLGFGLSCEDSDCTIYCMHCGVVCALHIVYGVFCSVNTKHSVKDKRAKFTCFQVSAATTHLLLFLTLSDSQPVSPSLVCRRCNSIIIIILPHYHHQ